MAGLLERLRKSFLTGLLVVLPLAGTVLLLVWMFVWCTDWLLPGAIRDGDVAFYTRAFALGLFLAIVTMIGWLTRRLVGKRLLALLEAVIERVPMLNKTYGFIKQIADSMMASNSSMFQRVVAVEYPRPGIYTIAFATNQVGGETAARTGEDLVGIFLPTPPNPTTGYLTMFPRSQVVELEMSVADAMKMSFTGGAVVPAYVGGPTSDPERIKG